ncbi:Os07g0671901, partial [Oryza sativa Japonica Group]
LLLIQFRTSGEGYLSPSGAVTSPTGSSPTRSSTAGPPAITRRKPWRCARWGWRGGTVLRCNPCRPRRRSPCCTSRPSRRRWARRSAPPAGTAAGC